MKPSPRSQPLNGHLLGLSDEVLISGSVAVAVPSGSHTVRLCAVPNTGSGFLIIGSLVAEWTAGGQVDVAGGRSSPIPDSYRQLLLDALGA